MVGNTGTLMTMRIVRSKLRKRDELSSTGVASVTTVEAQQNHGLQSRSTFCDNQDQQTITKNSLTSDGSINSIELETVTFTRTSISSGTTNSWVFPPKAPSPNIYNSTNHDSMVASNERNGFKGLKKQFSGRFKRLVSNKKETTSPIPPELKPQLKTIYVY